jgi:hypothetical protein
MEEFDYHTVMEERIRYFSQKYDPHNRIKPGPGLVKKREEPPKPKLVSKEPNPVKKKILVGLDAIISVFL